MRNRSCYPLLLAALTLLPAGCATISAPVPAPVQAPVAAVPEPAVPHLGYFEQQQHDLETQLTQEMRQGVVEIDAPQTKELTITLSTDASFTAAGTQLRPVAQETLDKIGATLRRFDHTSLTVTGYSDQAGNPIEAQQLSEARARQVAQYLAAQGVAAARIQASGRGEADPRASNRTEFGRALNRRIQITVLPDTAG